MPKEITHWMVARQVAAALQGSKLGELATAFPNCMQLGAVLHDAGYYARNHRFKKPLLAFTDTLHAESAEASTIINILIEAAAQSRNPGPVRAMILGMLTHIATDKCFHPLVYFETGNYHDPDPAKRTLAVQKHRQFETILDVYLAGTMQQVQTFSLKQIINGAELQVSTLLQEAFAKVADVVSFPQLPEALLHSFSVFSRMQALYAHPLAIHILEPLHAFLPNTGREIAALFYLPGIVKAAPGLHGSRRMPNTETGEETSVTILDLYNSSIQNSLEVCRELESALTGAVQK